MEMEFMYNGDGSHVEGMMAMQIMDMEVYTSYLNIPDRGEF